MVIKDVSLAIAIAVMRTKPEDINIQEYLLLLRSHLTNSKPIDATPSFIAFNAASYWQSLYLKSHEKHSGLLAQIGELEMQNQTLATTNDALAADNSSQPAKKKRRSSAKKPKAAPAEGTLADLNVMELCQAKEHKELLSRVFHLQSSLQPHNREAAKVSRILQELCSSLQARIAELPTPESSAVKEEPIRALARIVGLAFDGLYELAAFQKIEEPLEPHTSYAIHAVLCVLRQLLDTLQQEATNTENRHVGAQDSTLNEATSRIQWVRILLEAFTARAFWQNTQHKPKRAQAALQEGTVSLLLQRAGQLLHLRVFSHILADTVHNDMRLEMNVKEQKDETQIAAAQVEAKVLLPILTAAIAGMESRMQGDGRLPKLVGALQEKLQATLLTGVFGPNVAGGWDKLTCLDDFLGRARDAAQDHAQIEIESEEDVLQTLWELCGWDMLEKEVLRGFGPMDVDVCK